MYHLAKPDELHRVAFLSAAAAALAAAAGLALPFGPEETLRWAGPPLIALAVARGGVRPRVVAMTFALVALAGEAAWARYPLFADAVAGLAVGLVLLGEARASRRRRGVGDPPGKHQAAALLLGTLAWVIGIRSLGAAASSVLAQSMVPPLVLFASLGAFAGLLIGLTSAPAYLELDGDPVAAAILRARPSLDGELRELVHRLIDARGRALKLLERSRAEDVARTETKRGLDGLALAAIDLTDRFGVIDRVLAQTPPARVTERTTSLRARLELATDAAVRRDLERALGALEEQRAQIERLVQGRARLVARLESELANLERAEMALALFASGDAALAGMRLETIGQGLGRQASELEAEGFALHEALAGPPTSTTDRPRVG